MTPPAIWRRWRRWATRAVCVAALSALGAACGGGGGGSSSAAAPQNTFTNPGFEDGATAWASLTTDAWEPHYDISTAVAHSGTSSAYLKMRTDENTPATHIWGVSEEVSPKDFPAVLSGWYRVDNLQHATAKQYMQVVVIAFNSKNVPDPRFTNHQIRYILGGISEKPFMIENAKYIFLQTADPVQGQWIQFRRNVADDFKQQWGAVPEGFSSIRMLFEVRYDDKAAAERPSADVYYDDLLLGAGP